MDWQPTFLVNTYLPLEFYTSMFSFDQNADSDSPPAAPDAGDNPVERSSDLLDALQQLVDHCQSADASSTQRLDDLTEQLNETRQAVHSLTRSIEPVLDWVRGQESAGDAESGDEIDTNSWEYRKQSLLNDYSDDDEAAQSDSEEDDSPAASAPATSHTPAKQQLDGAEGSWLEDDTGDFDEAWSPEVMDLRSILEEKLRRAEIEISIERARLHRVNQELEQRRTDLELQVAQFEANAADGSDQQSGRKKSRLSRFLGRAPTDD